MHPALWISKTGLDAAQTDVSVVSNNLANASTVAGWAIICRYRVAIRINGWRRFEGCGNAKSAHAGQPAHDRQCVGYVYSGPWLF